MTQKDKVIVGRLGSPYGIKGWLHLISFTTPIENIFSYENWCLCTKNSYQPTQVETYKSHGKGYVIKLKHINDRETAAQNKGLEIAVERSELPDTNTDEYYWTDLIGASVITTSGENLGKVDYILATGANDVIVTKGTKQHMIPYIDHVVKSVNIDENKIIVDWEPF